MSQTFGEVVAELPHVDRHFVERRRDMGANLHIHIAKTPGPIGKQMTGQPLVAEAEPFRGDHDLFWAALKNIVVDGDERNGEPFGDFLIGETAFGGFELASVA